MPRILHRNGRLTALYTDYWAGPVTKAVAGRLKMGVVQSLGARHHPELVNGQQSVVNGLSAAVHSWNFKALWWETILRSQRSVACRPYHGFIEVGHRFAVRVREALKRRSDLGSDSIIFAYDTGALEAMQWCREEGIKCVLSQMDPNRVEVELVRAEENQWSDWALQDTQVPEEYFVRREREWALADLVVVNSEFSRQALLRQGCSS